MIELRDITKTYTTGDIAIPVLKGVSLTIGDGELCAIMGPSGSGKSTLMNIIGCLDTPTDGAYVLDGAPVATLGDTALAQVRNERIGFVFQSFNLLKRTTAVENVALPLMYAGADPRERRARAIAALEMVGLGDRLYHRPNQLSGGQQQRVAIARALVTRPTLILADEPTGNIDAEASVEVMEIFQRLNRDLGITIVFVTHEPELAGYTRRILRIRSGLLVADEPVAHPRSAAAERAALSDERIDMTRKREGQPEGQGIETAQPDVLTAAPHRRRKVGAPLRESIRSSRASLRGNLLRTALTMLGIVIGVGAVVALLAIGNGVKAEARANLERNGTNLITVQPELNATSGSANNTLTLEDAQALRNTGSAPSIETVSASVLTVTQITVGATSTFGEVRGVDPSYAAVHSYTVSQGAFINEAQEASHQQVIVLGAQTATKLFSGGGAVGKSVRINGKSFKVIGVMEEKGGSGFGSLDTGTYVPLSTALTELVGGRQRSVGSGKTVNLIEVKAKSAERVNAAIEEITRILTARHKLGVGGKPDFQVRNQADQIKSALATQNLLTIFLVVIASISLLVGGIGIMNIMLVSVTERTREIGIRKAVGARSQDILTQFLVESVLISVLGAVVGVLTGIAASLIVTAVWKRALVSPGSIVAAMIVAMAIGLFFGVYPARRASLLRPIEALRYE